MPLVILVADDDLGIRLSVSDYLEANGYSAIAAENGHAALGMVEQYHPHLLVTDILMPQMDGYELVRRVRQLPAFRLLPVIFLTSKGEAGERIRGYQAGCDFYLAKPFIVDELGAMVRNLLERSQIVQSELHTRISTPERSLESSNKEEEARIPQIDLKLTKREQEVLGWLVDGLSNSQIGTSLHLSPRTVEKYVSSLLRKTTTNNRAELVRFAMEQGLVDWKSPQPRNGPS